MAPKPSTVRGIFLDWDPTVRNDVTQGDWENGVLDVLQTLMLPPCDTSQAVLDGISATGKKVTIIPVRQPLVPGKKDANAYTNPIDPLTATTRGGKPENVLPQNPPILGVGGGSDSVIEFAAQDSEPASPTASLNAEDEALLHELVHALRQTSGIEDSIPLQAPFEVLRRGDGSISQLMSQTTATKPTKHSQIYNDYEEFVAVLITNIYRSENKRPGLTRDHLPDSELTYPLTNARNFLTVWRPQIARLCGDSHLLCNKLAAVVCHFNPIFEFYVAQNRFLPGGRRVS